MSFVRDTSRHIVISGLSLVISFIYQIWLTRLMGIEHIASVQSIFSLQVIFSTLFLSYNMSLTRVIIRGTENEWIGKFVSILNRTHRLHVVATLAIIVIYLVLLSLDSNWIFLAESIATVLFFLGSFLFNSFQAMTSGLQRFGQLSSQVFLYHLFRLGALFVIGLFSQDRSIVMFAVAISIMSINLYCMHCIRDYVSAKTKLPIKKDVSLQFSKKEIEGQKALLVGNLGLAVLANSDVIIIRLFSATSEAGNYSAAATFTRALYLLISAAGSILFPFLLKNKISHDRTVRLLFAFSICVLLGCLGLNHVYTLVPNHFYQLFLGPSYASIGDYIGGSTLMYAAIGCLSIQFSVYSAAYENRFSYYLFFGAILAVGSCILLQLHAGTVVQVLTGISVLLICTGFFLQVFTFSPVLLDRPKTD